MADATQGGESPGQDVAKAAGRGVLLIAAAKMYFIVASSALELLLPKLLGAVVFGAYGFVTQAVSAVNNVIVTGTIQAVSRFTTAEPESADAVKARGLKLHLLVGVPIALLFAVCAPVIAARVHDPGKAGPLALASIIVAAYAFYCVFVGSANGTRAFHKQALLDITFATLRVAGIVGAAKLGLGLYGMVSGWAAAAITICLVAAVWVGVPRAGAWAGAGSIKPMAAYLGGLAAYLFLTNLLLSADAFLLKRLSAEWFHAQGVGLEEAARLSDAQVGYYRAVQVLARLPYQLMLAVTFIVFPLVSRATFERDLETTRGYIRTTMRYSLIASALMGSVLAARPTALLDVPYPTAFADVGGPALAILALGHVAFVVFTIAGTVLNSAGRTRDAIAISSVTLALVSGALWFTIPRFAPGWQMLQACAAATTAAMVLGAILSGLALIRRFGTFLPLATLVRVGLAVGATIAVGRLSVTRQLVPTAGLALVCGAVYVVVLVATRELAGADLALVGRVLGRKRV